MKQRFLLKMVLVAAGLFMGLNGAWAEDGDITSLPYNVTFTAGGVTTPFNSGIIMDGTNVDGIIPGRGNTITAFFDTDDVADSRTSYSLSDNETVTITFKAFHGWWSYSGGGTFSVLNSDGKVLAGYTYNCNTTKITDVKLGDNTAATFEAFDCISYYNATQNANGFGGNGKPYLAGDNYNPTITITIAKSGYVSLRIVLASKNIDQSYAAQLDDVKMDLAKLTLASIDSRNGGDDRTLGINNLSVTSEIFAVTQYSYTIIYKDENGDEIYRENGTGDENTTPAISTDDFWYGGKKYNYVSDDAAPLTANETIITVSCKEEEKNVYTVNAVDANNGIIKANIQSGFVYVGEEGTTSFYIPACVLVNETLHFTTNEANYKTETVENNNQVFSYAYTSSSVDNVVFLAEGEDLAGATQCIATNNQRLASFGFMGRGTNLPITTLPKGKYTIYVHYINTNSGAHTVVVNAGEEIVMNETNVKARPTLSADFTLTESTALTLTAAGSSTSGVDYIYIVKTGDVEVATITAAKYATFIPTMKVAVPDGVKAYYVTNINANGKARMEEVSVIPANKAVILYKDVNEDTEVIFEATDAAEVNLSNILNYSDAETVADGTQYILADGEDGVGFYKAASGSTIAARKAYLEISAAASFLSFSFDDETTGIEKVENAAVNANGTMFNLAGQRVAQPTKGLYIVNGKKVVIK